MAERVLITGANRGIGLEFVRQCAARGDRVVAACRSPGDAGALHDLSAQHIGRIVVTPLDVTAAPSIAAAIQEAAAHAGALDVLINNAAIYSTRLDEDGQPAERLGDLDEAEATAVLRVNAVAPLMLAQACMPLLQRGARARIVNITSGYGSVSGNTGSHPYYYSASKAALNMFTRSLAGECIDRGIIAFVLEPGWVRTDMGGPAASLSPRESVAGMLRVIDRVTRRENGAFLDHTGRRQPW